MNTNLRSQAFCAVTLIGCLLLAQCSDLFAQVTHYDVLKGDKMVGKILASRTLSGERTTYLMTSYSEIDVIWKRVVRSTGVTEYHGPNLRSCHTNMLVNDALRDSSHMAPTTKGSPCYVHPNERFAMEEKVQWTTGRMYFEEPVGQTSIFVESVLRYCPLVKISETTYKLEMPDSKTNFYTYSKGQLQEILVDRTFFELTFRRAKD